MVKKKVIWDELARTALRKAYDYIKKDSVLKAEKVKQEIITEVKSLADNPGKYPPDKYRKDKIQSSVPLRNTAIAFPILLQKIQSGCFGCAM